MHNVITESSHQFPIGIAILLIVVRKRLAGRTTNQNSRLTNLEQLQNIFRFKIVDVTKNKRGLVVIFERVPTSRIYVNTGCNIEPFQPQAVRQAACGTAARA